MANDYVKDLDIRSAEDYVLLDSNGYAITDSEENMITLYNP